jgi:DNA invertase Pin-like site-specific DNA recombinase
MFIRAKGRKHFAALFEDAHKRKFDSVLFWSLDRFSREGMVPTILHLQHLTTVGVGFHSYTEPHLATDDELVRNILLSVLSSLAKVEAQKIGERTRAGMAKAKAAGKHIGRPSISSKLQDRIAERVKAGETPYRIAKDLGIDRHTVAKYARPFEANAAASDRAAERCRTFSGADACPGRIPTPTYRRQSIERAQRRRPANTVEML